MVGIKSVDTIHISRNEYGVPWFPDFNFKQRLLVGIGKLAQLGSGASISHGFVDSHPPPQGKNIYICRVNAPPHQSQAALPR